MTDLLMYGTLAVSLTAFFCFLAALAVDRSSTVKALHDRLDELENAVANLETELRSRKN
jgi:hypothetical protein